MAPAVKQLTVETQLIHQIAARHAPVTAITSVCALALMIGPAVASAAPAAPVNVTVNSTADAAPSAGVCQLRDAINAINGAASTCSTTPATGTSTIIIPSNVTGAITLLGSRLTISAPVTINGPGANNLSISGNNSESIFYILNTATNVTISGLTLTNARAPVNGGAILSSAPNLTLVNSTVSGSTAPSSGGGVCVIGGNLTLTNSTVSGNSVTGVWSGGGLFLENGNLTLTNSTVSGNTSTRGAAGLYMLNGNLTLTNSTVTGNTSATYGGGLFVNDTNATLTSSTVSGNTAIIGGGGLYEKNGTLTLNSSTVSGNTTRGSFSAHSGGAGMYLANVNATLTNSTLSGNASSAFGGGMNFIVPAGDNNTLTLTNSTISGNTSVNGGDGVAEDNIGASYFSAVNSIIAGNGRNACNTGPITGGSNNLVTDNSCGTSSLLFGVPVTMSDINLGLLQNNGGPTQTMALIEPSVAIGNGTDNGAPATDQRGIPRPHGNIDIGAFQYSSAASSSGSGSGSNAYPYGNNNPQSSGGGVMQWQDLLALVFGAALIRRRRVKSTTDAFLQRLHIG
jgi:CSLREA domain-containing protein